MLAELVAPASRTSVFAQYNFVGYLATALGSAEAGKMVDVLQHSWHWTLVASCHAVFIQYSMVASLMIVIVSSVMLKQCSSLHRTQHRDTSEPLLHLSDSENETASGPDQASLNQETQDSRGALGLSSESMHVLVHLSLLFALDSFAGGLVTGEQKSHLLQLTCPCRTQCMFSVHA